MPLSRLLDPYFMLSILAVCESIKNKDAVFLKLRPYFFILFTL